VSDLGLIIFSLMKSNNAKLDESGVNSTMRPVTVKTSDQARHISTDKTSDPTANKVPSISKTVSNTRYMSGEWNEPRSRCLKLNDI
jgi:hypothetical protein